MNIRSVLTAILLTSSILGSFPVAATDNSSPIGIDLVPYVQFPNTEFSINGLRLSVVGMNREARGLDLALIGNITTQTFKGLAISGLFNYNKVTSDIIGLQFATLANINMASSRLYGIQIGAYNSVNTVYGLQLGLVNVTSNLHGVQIGLLNFNSGGPFKATPIINIGF